MQNTKLISIVLAALCFPILFVQLAIMLPAILDDVYITFRYGQNLATGLGLVWNAGEAPVEGYTSTLAVLISASSIVAGVNPMVTVKLIGIVSATVTLAMFLFYGNALSVKERALAAMFLLASPDVAYYGTAGMENIWVLPIIAYLVLRHLELETFRRSTYLWIGLILAALCYIRPEGHLIALFFVALHVWRYVSGQAVTRQDLLALLLPPIVLVGSLHIARFAWFGDLLPNTYYAKHSGGSLADSLITAFLYLGERFYPVYGFLWVLAVFFLLRLRTALAALCLALLFAFPLYVLKVGGDDRAAFAGARLLIPIIPVMCLFAAKFCVAALTRTFASAVGMIAMVIVMISAGSAWYVDMIKLLYGVDSLSVGVRERIVRGVAKHVAFLHHPDELALSRYLKKTVPPHEYVALPWAGRVPYETRLPTIDLLGLNDRHIARRPKLERGTDMKYDANYVLARKPRVICENVRVRSLQITQLSKMTDAQLLALGAFKMGQRELLRSPVLASEYKIDLDGPGDGCFRLKKQTDLPHAERNAY